MLYKSALVLRRVTLLACLAVGMIQLTGCTHTPVQKPLAHIEVPLAKIDERPRVPVKIFTEIKIHLPPITTPGNVWVLVYNDGRYLKELGSVETANPADPTASFLAVRQCRPRVVRFFALPPHAREAVPAQSYEVVVEIE